MTQILCATMAGEPHDMSLLYYLWYLHSAGGVRRVGETENAAQERKFVGGSQQISNKIKDRLDGKVLLNSPVTKLVQDADHVTVTCLDGKSYAAQYAISAMPQAILNSVFFDPPFPPLKNQLIQHIPMGSVIKTVTFYDRPLWREKGLNGTILADEEGPIQAALDDTKPDGSHPAIMGFIVGNKARELCTKTQEERKKLVTEQYAKAFQTDEALKPVFYIDKNWPAEKFSGGCYVTLAPPGVLTQFGPALREPFGRVYFGGTETATKWSGYMDGAVEAGERAAREVLHAMGKITKEEIFQEEPPSKDVPPVPLEFSLFKRWLPSAPDFEFAARAVAFIALMVCLRRSLK